MISELTTERLRELLHYDGVERRRFEDAIRAGFA
jgi:hypothetical protein